METTIDSVRVLHVDPDGQVAKTLAEFLRQEDDRVEVIVAQHPEEGLDRIGRGDVDCVVSDYKMRGMNGLAFLEAVRETHPDLPFILFTGKGSENIASEAISAGVTDYLQKGGPETYELVANKVINSVRQYRSEAAARRTERRLHEIADHANDVLWMFAGDWSELLFINEAYEEVYGRSVDRLREDAGDFMRAVHPEDRSAVEATIERLSAGQSEEIEYRVNGTENYGRWVWAHGEPIVEDGEVVRIVGFSRDVTQRTERESELALRGRAMDEAPVGIVITDPDLEDNPIAYVNDGFTRLTGYDARDALGRNCRFVQGDRTDPDRVARLREAIDAGESVSVELRNYRKDGTEFWNKLDVAPVTDEEGTVTNFIGFQQDVTDRKRREQLNEVLNRVLRHNLRNDVNTIQGFANLLLEDLPEDSDHAEYATAISERARSLLALSETAGTLEDTLGSAGSASDKPVARLVRSAAERVRTRYPRGTIGVDDEEAPTAAVPKPIEAAIAELIENAVKHTDSAVATVCVGWEDGDGHTGREESGGRVERKSAGGRVRIEVRDDGPGIPEQDRQVLETGRETPLEHGSGLGLWLVHRVVADCGGTVEVTESDDGTSVVVWLPER